MKKLSYRTTMPFHGGLSPATDRSHMPFNNVHTILDVLSGIEYNLPGGGGDWSSGEDLPSSYKEEGDRYKRESRDLDILSRMTTPLTENTEQWKVKVNGGYRIFNSFSEAQMFQKKAKEKGIFSSYITKVAQATQESKISVIANSLEKTFKTESVNYEKQVMETGSAFCVGPNLFMTCAHCINRYDKANINKNLRPNVETSLVKEGRKIPATLVNIDYVLDVALIRAEIDIEPFEFDQGVKIGTEVVAIGSPHGYDNNVTEGIISSLDRSIYKHEGAPNFIFFDAFVASGNSGGPIVDEISGKVLGMVTLIVGGETGVGLNAGLPSSYLERFLQTSV